MRRTAALVARGALVASVALVASGACVGAGCASARSGPGAAAHPQDSSPPKGTSAVTVDPRVSDVLETYRDRLECFDTSNIELREPRDCRSSPLSTRARAVDLSSTARAPLAALALVAADHAARVLAPRLLVLTGRQAMARRMAGLSPITSLAEAQGASELLVASIDQNAAARAWWSRSIDWRGELGSSYLDGQPPREPTPRELLEFALTTLSHSMTLEPESSQGDFEGPPPYDVQLTSAILDTITSLEIAASATLERSEAENLATETFLLLVTTARRLDAARSGRSPPQP